MHPLEAVAKAPAGGRSRLVGAVEDEQAAVRIEKARQERREWQNPGCAGLAKRALGTAARRISPANRAAAAGPRHPIASIEILKDSSGALVSRKEAAHEAEVALSG